MKKHVSFLYLNHRGKTQFREVFPKSIWFGKSPYYQGENWYMKAWCRDRKADRDFLMAKIIDWNENAGNPVGITIGVKV